MRSLSLLLLAAILLVPAALAQRPQPGSASPERDGGWLVLGVGTGFDDGGSTTLVGSFGRERFVQAGYHGTGNFCLTSKPCPGIHTWHVGAGLSAVDRWQRFSISAGPAWVHGRREVGGRRWHTAGLVVGGQALFTPIPEVGVGINAFAVVNAVDPTAGVGFVFVLEGNK